MSARHGSQGRTRGRRTSPPVVRRCIVAGVKELNEMTIGRNDDPENPISVSAFEAAKVFGTGSRIPSGPAAYMSRQQAGHMCAIDPPSIFSSSLLNPRGRPHMTLRELSDFNDLRSPPWRNQLKLLAFQVWCFIPVPDRLVRRLGKPARSRFATLDTSPARPPPRVGRKVRQIGVLGG
jgi:hypothetical protein